MLAERTGSPSKSSSPDHESIPEAVDGDTDIGASMTDCPLLCPSDPEMFTIVSESHVDP